MNFITLYNEPRIYAYSLPVVGTMSVCDFYGRLFPIPIN